MEHNNLKVWVTDMAVLDVSEVQAVDPEYVTCCRVCFELEAWDDDHAWAVLCALHVLRQGKEPILAHVDQVRTILEKDENKLYMYSVDLQVYNPDNGPFITEMVTTLCNIFNRLS